MSKCRREPRRRHGEGTEPWRPCLAAELREAERWASAVGGGRQNCEDGRRTSARLPRRHCVRVQPGEWPVALFPISRAAGHLLAPFLPQTLVNRTVLEIIVLCSLILWLSEN